MSVYEERNHRESLDGAHCNRHLCRPFNGTYCGHIHGLYILHHESLVEVTSTDDGGSNIMSDLIWTSPSAARPHYFSVLLPIQIGCRNLIRYSCTSSKFVTWMNSTLFSESTLALPFRGNFAIVR